MQEINIYKASAETFHKIFTKLIESIIAQNKRIYILCHSQEEMENLDYLLWSYSQLSFIPHATTSDPYKNEQKVLLGLELHHDDSREIFLSILNEQINLEVLQNLSDKYEKILLFSLNDDNSFDELKNLNTKVNLVNQDLSGKWIKYSLN